MCSLIAAFLICLIGYKKNITEIEPRISRAQVHFFIHYLATQL